MKLFETHVRFLRHVINHGKITVIEKIIEFASKFLDTITDIKQLQSFLSSLNYIFRLLREHGKGYINIVS